MPAAKLIGLTLLAGVALGHGESGRAQAPGGGGVPTIIVPTGGPTTGRPDPARRGPTTDSSGKGPHTWKIWWAYHREMLLAEALRKRPITGIAVPANERLKRKQLRESGLEELMLGALEDKHQSVRAAAAVALGKFGDPAAARALERHAGSPPEGWFTVREAALYALGALGSAGERSFLMGAAADKDRSFKERSLALLGGLMDGTERSGDWLVFELRNTAKAGIRATAGTPAQRSSQDRRRFAAHLLGFSSQPGIDELLYAAARGSRAWGRGVRGLAVTALGRRRNREYKPALFRLFYARGAPDAVKRSVPIALGLMLDPNESADVRRLGRFVKDSRRDPIAQHFTVMALGSLGGATAVEILEGYLRGKVFRSDDDRGFLYLALGLAGRKSGQARKILRAAYEGARTWKSREVLAVACSLARVEGALARTLGLLDKAGLGSGEFLAWGALALGLCGDRRGVAVAERIFDRYADPLVREKAALALVLLLRGKAVPRLVRLLREAGSLHAKGAAVTALGLLPDPTRKAVDALVAAYRDDSVSDEVRAMAIAALGTLGDPRPVPLSALLVGGYNYFIRCAALDAIAFFL